VFELLMPLSEHQRWKEDALKAARKLGRIYQQCYLLLSLASMYSFLGEPERSIRNYEESLGLARAAKLRVWEGRTLYQWAQTLFIYHQQYHRDAQAILLAESGAGILNEIGDPHAKEASKLVESLKNRSSKAG
jgi:hypothetical protein